MKGIVRDIDKAKCLELLSDHNLHTSSEIESATGNWWVNNIIRKLRAEGHKIVSKRIGIGLYGYRLLKKPAGEQKLLFK